MTYEIHHGDALDVLPTFPEASMDAVVTDPPYELGFMGRAWDASGVAYSVDLWRECLRVLKPGGHLLAFGGTRTVHRVTVAIEDAGFEIRDGIDWLYGSGFPKSLNIGDGRGTALKPAREPIVMARKPLAGTVAANAQQYGTGALNIDACQAESGRWPANAVMSHAPDCGPEECLSGCPVAELDAQSAGTRAAKPSASGNRVAPHQTGSMSGTLENVPNSPDVVYLDSGGASRFFPVFRYQAKAPTRERPKVDGIGHPTVKPLALMQWLVRLVTPSGGTVLDPFLGSGTTLEACELEGFHCIGIEREAMHLPLIQVRVDRVAASEPA